MKRVLLAALALVVMVSVLACTDRAVAQGGASGSQAAAAPTRNWYSVSLFTVKPDRVRDFVDLMKTQTIPMQQKGGIKDRDTWQNGAPFGDGFTYGVVTPIAKFADYDMPPLPQRVLGDAARAYTDKLNSMLDARRTFAVMDRAELSIPPAAGAKIVGAILTDVTIVSGHAEQYEAYIKNDLLPVLKQGKVLGYSVSRTTFGGNGNEYHTVQYFDSFAEIDKGPIPTRVLGAAAAQALNVKATPHIAGVNRTILRYVPDLSFHPRPTT